MNESHVLEMYHVQHHVAFILVDDSGKEVQDCQI
jgi:hypothetical protein